MSRILARQLEALIAQGKSVVQSSSPRNQEHVDPDRVAKWRVQCRALVTALGKYGGPWTNSFEDGDSRRSTVQLDQAQLEGLAEAIEMGLLVRIEDLVYAGAFADLMEQAAHLLERDWALAAGVVLRAVLEERLKILCERNECMPTKDRPTIEDYKQKLQKAGVIDPIAVKGVDQMAAVGNYCAHNKQPPLLKADVEALRRNLAEFLVRFSS